MHSFSVELQRRFGRDHVTPHVSRNLSFEAANFLLLTFLY